MTMRVDTGKIFIAMAEQGYNGAELARAAGVTPAAVNNVLNGKRRGTEKVLGAICKVLGLSVKDVLIIED